MTAAKPPRPLLVIGAGGHARVVVALLRRLNREVLACVDAADGEGPRHIAGVAVWHGDARVLDHAPGTVELANGIASTGRPILRRTVFERFRTAGYSFPILVDPSACVFDDAELAEGCQVMAGAVVQTGARLGENTLVNTRAIVEHDCKIGRHCHIAPGAVLSGTVTTGDCCHIGVGAAVLQGVSIGTDSVVGAGAAVIADIAKGAVVGGVPARPLHR